MEQVLLHMIGDYITQNNWMAQNKVKFTKIGWLACFIHALFYSLPFIFLCPNVTSWIVIFVTHFLIDKFRLAVYWIKLVNWNWKSTNFGFDSAMPTFLSMWLLFIIDNTFHITINYLSIKYL